MEDDSRLPQSELKYWLALLRTPGLGSVTLRRLLDQTPEAADLFRRRDIPEPVSRLPEKSRRALEAPDWAGVEADLLWSEQPGHRIVTLADPLYPELLAILDDAPLLLFVHGDAELLCSPQIAVVGSRNPSPSGKATGMQFAEFLAGMGITITSGLAVGIDGAAHQGALDAGGKTIAVMGTGLDRVYPASHRALAHDIANGGALVSEFPLGTPVSRGNFPRRNRIIAGMSLGTLVVEAALQSGSLITARLAADQGREVFAIPGSIHNPLARGCHALIRQGAKLVENGADIVEELPALFGSLTVKNEEPSRAEPAVRKTWDADYRRLFRFLGFDPVSADTLVELSGLTADKVSSMLLLLELEGYVSSAPGGRYQRTGKIEG